MKLDTLMKESVDRRGFVTRMGALGLGVAAAGILAGCGGSDDGGGGGSYYPSVSGSEVKAAFQEIQKDERDHVTFLVTALGSAARPEPTFTTSRLTAPDLQTFVKQSAALENTGTGAYLAAVPLPALIASPSTLQAAASIALVEGRHAGFLNSLLSRPLLTDPLATPPDTTMPNNLSREVAELPDTVLARALPFTGTIGNGATFNTNLNGGPALPTNATIASATLTDILNYALFLEYLERDYYNINVPKFFS